MTLLDQDDVDQEDDVELDQEDDVEHDRQVRSLEERLRRLSIVGEPEFIVAGNLDEGYSVDIPKSGGGEEASGACCTSGTCSIETEEDCTGFYLGDNTTCDGVDCAVGACCIDGVCSITTEADCTGTYEGDGTVCTPNPCPQPTGACCVGDVCTIETASECSGIGGIYQGDDTTCDPNPCITPPPPTGACCIGTDCSILTAAECSGAGGTYQGDGSPCSPNPCTEPCCGACYFPHDGSKYKRKDVSSSGSCSCDPESGFYSLSDSVEYDVACNKIVNCSGSGDGPNGPHTWEHHPTLNQCWWRNAFGTFVTNDPIYPMRCFEILPTGACPPGVALEDMTDSCSETYPNPPSGPCSSNWSITVAYGDPCADC